MAYTIEKQPRPDGTLKTLRKPVTVNSVTGVDNVFTEGGELRGSIDAEIGDNEYLSVTVRYQQNYSDGTTSEWVTPGRQDADNPSFTLSLAPFGWKLASVDISVTYEKRTEPAEK